MYTHVSMYKLLFEQIPGIFKKYRIEPSFTGTKLTLIVRQKRNLDTFTFLTFSVSMHSILTFSVT